MRVHYIANTLCIQVLNVWLKPLSGPSELGFNVTKIMSVPEGRQSLLVFTTESFLINF